MSPEELAYQIATGADHDDDDMPGLPSERVANWSLAAVVVVFVAVILVAVLR